VIDSVNGNAHVYDCKKPIRKMFVHCAKINSGTLKVGDKVDARVDAARRDDIRRHHTATHLLQAALQNILGAHVHQAGSLVTPDKLRFDFTHFEGIDTARLQDIELLINNYIQQDNDVNISNMSLDEARAAGAMALFGEKYEDIVRVVRCGDYSMELCGGTHVARTGVIGVLKILGESSVSSGVRRVEAVCGQPGVEAIQSQERQLNTAARMLSTPPDHLVERVQTLLDENKRLAREVAKWKQAAATGGAVDYMSKVQDVNGVKVLAVEVEGQDADGLRLVLDKLRDQLGSGVIVLGSAVDGKASLCVGVSKDLTGKIKAGDIVKQIAPIIGGGGGGRPDMAQAGGKEVDKLTEALEKVAEVVAGMG